MSLLIIWKWKHTVKFLILKVFQYNMYIAQLNAGVKWVTWCTYICKRNSNVCVRACVCVCVCAAEEIYSYARSNIHWMFFILMMRSDKCIIPGSCMLHELLSHSPAPHPHVRPPRSPPSWSFSAQRQMFPDIPGHGVCVYIYMYVRSCWWWWWLWGLKLSPMTNNSVLHAVYSGFAMLCLLNACFSLAGVFVTCKK